MQKRFFLVVDVNERLGINVQSNLMVETDINRVTAEFTMSVEMFLRFFGPYSKNLKRGLVNITLVICQGD